MGVDDPLVIEEHPSRAEIDRLEQRIFEFNVAQTGYDDGRDIGIFIRDALGELEAGLWGFTWGGCMRIEYLWVSEALRGKGVGTRLLHAAQEEARRRGCLQVLLDTHTFQAPGFYAKHGYETFATVADYPRGWGQDYLRLRLDR